MSTAKRLHFDYDEYLRALEMSELKLEYCDGVIYAMAGGTLAHAQLGAAMIGALLRCLPQNCRVATSNMKVRIESTDLSTFPDASVTCGEAKTSRLDANALINPSILVEVTSKSTEDYDRGDKLAHYKQIEGLRAVLYVSHRMQRITVIERGSNGWTETEHRAGESVKLSACADYPNGVLLTVNEVYEGIMLDAR